VQANLWGKSKRNEKRVREVVCWGGGGQRLQSDGLFWSGMIKECELEIGIHLVFKRDVSRHK